MMRYRVKERRAYYAEYIIEANNEQAAGKLQGKIIEEDDNSGDSWGDELISVDEVDEDEEL